MGYVYGKRHAVVCMLTLKSRNLLKHSHDLWANDMNRTSSGTATPLHLQPHQPFAHLKSQVVVAPTVFPSCADVYPRSKSPQVTTQWEGTKLIPGLAGPTAAELREGRNRPQLCVSKLSELSEQRGM